MFIMEKFHMTKIKDKESYGSGGYPRKRGIDPEADKLIDEGYVHIINLSAGNDIFGAVYHKPTKMFLSPLSINQYNNAVKRYSAENIRIANNAYTIYGDPCGNGFRKSMWAKPS